MKLYLVHCGFYDQALAEGDRNIFEGHHNFFVAAESPADAKSRAKEKPLFKEKKMHVDGLQEVEAVDGWRVVLEPAPGEGSRIAATSYDQAKTL